MAKQVTIRRGTTAEHSNFAGAEGEVTVDTTKDTVVVHDGETQGGFPLEKEGVALPKAGGEMSGNITMAGFETVDGRDLSVDGTKLDGIEASATADQSDAEIKTAYENNADTNAFTNAEQSKLSGIGTIATQDSDAVAITGGSVTGITDLTVADGGTGASDASTARSNLGSTTVGDAVFVATDEEVARAAMLVPNKNVIINGNFDIWQRGLSGFGHNVYNADRWLELTNTDDTLSISRQAFTTGQTDVPNEPEFFLRAVLTAGSTGTVNDFRQRVEGVRTFAGETVTLSYYAKASVGFTQTNRRIVQIFGGGGSAAVVTSLPNIAITVSWQKFTDTITLPPIDGSTVGTNRDDFIDVVLGLPLNTTTTVDIAQVQLEKGSVATEFERRSIVTELAMAQRYFLRGLYGATGTITSATSANVAAPFPVEMRKDPTISINNTAPRLRINGGFSVTGSGSTLTNILSNKQGFSTSMFGFTGRTVGEDIVLIQADTFNFDAEL